MGRSCRKSWSDRVSSARLKSAVAIHCNSCTVRVAYCCVIIYRRGTRQSARNTGLPSLKIGSAAMERDSLPSEASCTGNHFPSLRCPFRKLTSSVLSDVQKKELNQLQIASNSCHNITFALGPTDTPQTIRSSLLSLRPVLPSTSITSPKSDDNILRCIPL